MKLFEKYRDAAIKAIPAAICIAVMSVLSVAFVAALPGAIEQITEQGRAVVAASMQ